VALQLRHSEYVHALLILSSPRTSCILMVCIMLCTARSLKYIRFPLLAVGLCGCVVSFVGLYRLWLAAFGDSLSRGRGTARMRSAESAEFDSTASLPALLVPLPSLPSDQSLLETVLEAGAAGAGSDRRNEAVLTASDAFPRSPRSPRTLADQIPLFAAPTVNQVRARRAATLPSVEDAPANTQPQSDAVSNAVTAAEPLSSPPEVAPGATPAGRSRRSGRRDTVMLIRKVRAKQQQWVVRGKSEPSDD